MKTSRLSASMFILLALALLLSQSAGAGAQMASPQSASQTACDGSKGSAQPATAQPSR